MSVNPVSGLAHHPGDWEEILALWEKMGFASIDQGTLIASEGMWNTSLYVTIP